MVQETFDECFQYITLNASMSRRVVSNEVVLGREKKPTRQLVPRKITRDMMKSILNANGVVSCYFLRSAQLILGAIQSTSRFNRVKKNSTPIHRLLVFSFVCQKQKVFEPVKSLPISTVLTFSETTKIIGICSAV